MGATQASRPASDWKNQFINTQKNVSIVPSPPKTSTYYNIMLDQYLLEAPKQNDIALTKFFEALHGS